MSNASPGFWFPGRWLGGLSLIAAPLLLLTGILLRIQFSFYFPNQLAAYHEHPFLLYSAYACFVMGNILLWPAIVTLATFIGSKKPGWGIIGGGMVLFGLFARTFHAGVDHLSFQLVKQEGVEQAQKIIAASYGAFYITSIFSMMILTGWIVLAIGCYLSKTLNLFYSICLGLMSILMIGVLKGSSFTSVIAASGLCIALIPLGIKTLRDGPTLPVKKLAGWSISIIAALLIFYFLGQAG